MVLYQVHPNLYIGSASLLYRQDIIDRATITAIVRLDDHEHGNTANWPQAKYTTLWMPFADEQPIREGLIAAIVEFIHVKLNKGEKVLVHCAAGRSRSTAMVIAYLCRYLAYTPQSALYSIKLTHPGAQPHPTLVESVNQYLDQFRPNA